jgi:hypothetical protein
VSDLPTVHVTDMVTFQTCRYRWDYSSPLRHNLQPRTPNKHLWLGTGLHHALAAYYGRGATAKEWGGLLTAYDAWVAAQLPAVSRRCLGVPEAIQDYAALGRAMLAHYARWAPDHDDFEVLVAEHKVALPFGAYVYKGAIDLVVRDVHGELWIVEHKSYTQLPDVTTLALTLQPAVYLYAARQDPALTAYGPIAGVLYNILRKSAPTAPKPLKGGGLERRANINASPYSYADAVTAAGLDVADYADFIAGLDPWRFNRRVALRVSDAQLRVAMGEFVWLANAMVTDPALYRGDAVRQCPGCDYLPLCTQRLAGQPWELLAVMECLPRGADDAPDVEEE